MSIKQLLESGGNLNDIPKLVDPSFNTPQKQNVDWGLNAVGPGDEDPNKVKELTPQQRQEWNRYTEYVEKRGYKGSTLLDKKETGLATSLFEDFKKENPDTSITLDHVASVQYEMQKLRDSAIAFAKRRGDPNAENIMGGISKIDSWPGSKTTQFKFPEMKMEEYRDNKLVSKKNMGLVDPDLNPSGGGGKKPLPKGAKLEKLADGHYYYEDPKSQDLVFYE